MNNQQPGSPKDPNPQQQTLVDARVKWPDLLRTNIRKMADGNYKRYSNAFVLPEWINFSSSSPEVSMFGQVTISIDHKKIFVPFHTGFVFTCITSGETRGQIEFSSSLN